MSHEKKRQRRPRLAPGGKDDVARSSGVEDRGNWVSSWVSTRGRWRGTLRGKGESVAIFGKGLQ